MTQHNITPDPDQQPGADPTTDDGDRANTDPARLYGGDVFRAIEQLQRQLDDHTATLQAHTQAVARLEADLRRVKALIQPHGPED